MTDQTLTAIATLIVAVGIWLLIELFVPREDEPFDIDIGGL